MPTQSAAAASATDAATAQTATDAGTQNGSDRTFTQAELDAIVTERIQRERKKGEEAAVRAREAAERKAAEEQGQFKALYEKTQADLERMTTQIRQQELSILRNDIAGKVGLPPQLANRLQGDTPEALEADAKALLALLPGRAQNGANAGAGARQSGGSASDMDAFIRAAAGRRSI